MNQFDIYERCEEFAVKTIETVEKIPYRSSVGIIKNQLIRSSSSIGANLCEADNARSKKEFVSCIGISLKEAKETLYWFRLLKRINKDFSDAISKLEFDCNTIKKILGKIHQNSCK